jgi:hypothetical protein
MGLYIFVVIHIPQFRFAYWGLCKVYSFGVLSNPYIAPSKDLQIAIKTPSNHLQKSWSPSKRLHFCIGKLVVKSNGVGRYRFNENTATL